ncbi:MAG TPA: TIGR03790 family protein [Nitrospirae bacterium]|nr:TIGR03790 family protein [Nitrospirota bacterium]
MQWEQACKIILTFFVSLLSLIFTIPGSTEAALLPEEIVVLVNSGSPDSISIGKLYMELRKVPVTHLIEVSVTTDERISRSDYDELIAEPVRKAVGELYDKGEKIRCIVTTYGIPLRIRAVKALIVPEDEINRYGRMKKQKKEKLSELEKQKKENKDHDEDLKREIKRLKSGINKLNTRLGYLRGADTVAAVDSELTLVLMPDYGLAGWQPNPEFLYNRKSKIVYPGQVLMVSRLDAPTPELAEGLIRTAIEVEKKGISGKIYLDARGKKGKDAYSRFDEDIRRTAQILKQSRMPVILDNRPELFGPGDAPSAALYCGWYSLGKYKDAFQWSEGAVGYHIASSEAVSLHDPKPEYWVKSMIERGVIATIGPVAEPYLHAFPPPSLFFPLLMSGKYALAEVFTMTNPLLSWRMILIGDPLYNPFKNNAAYVIKNLPPPPR